MSEQSTFPAWITPGATVVEVHEHLGKVTRVSTTTVARVTKTQFVLANASSPSDRYRATHVERDHARRREGGVYGGSMSLVYPEGDPRAVAAWRQVVTAKHKHATDDAAEAFRRDPSPDTARALAQSAERYAALADASADDFASVYRSVQEG